MCEFCKFWQDKDMQECQDSPLDQIKNNLDELKNLGIAYIDITGGEPLLRHDLPEILKFAKEKNFFVVLTTNCLLYPDRAKEITEHVDRLVFSLDSPIPDQHDTIRGTTCFDKFLESVKIARSLKKLPIINFTATRDTIRFLPEMAELARDLKCLVWLNPVYGHENLEGFENQTIQHIKYFWGNKFVSFNLAALELIKNFGNNIGNPKCKAGTSTITISADNKLMLPCHKNSRGKIEISGSIKDTIEKHKNFIYNQGRMDICHGCMMWPYLIPSFSYKIDKYFILNLRSLLSLYWKEFKLKKETEK